jgi:hypothetical protein
MSSCTCISSNPPQQILKEKALGLLKSKTLEKDQEF